MTSARTTPPAIPAGTLANAPQPVLRAAGELTLRPWDPADAAVFLGAYRDPEIQHWHTRQPASEDQVREWFDQYRRDWTQEKGAHWAVTRGGGGGEVLGRIAVRSMNLDDGVGECGYWVLPAARGAGVASGALTAVSVWAFGEAGFHRLELDHSTRNHASCRVATRSGFRLEGTKRSDAVHSDGRHDMHLHARIRADDGRHAVDG
jgi:RimJ/RimL family protein N-acetyltransferase